MNADDITPSFMPKMSAETEELLRARPPQRKGTPRAALIYDIDAALECRARDAVARWQEQRC